MTTTIVIQPQRYLSQLWSHAASAHDIRCLFGKQSYKHSSVEHIALLSLVRYLAWKYVWKPQRLEYLKMVKCIYTVRRPKVLAILTGEVYVRISGFVFTELKVGKSPVQLLIYLSKKTFVWIQVSKECFISFWKQKHWSGLRMCINIVFIHVCIYTGAIWVII